MAQHYTFAYTFATYRDVYPTLYEDYSPGGDTQDVTATYYGKHVIVLGLGASRVAMLDGDVVIKVAAPGMTYSNITEYETWRRVRGTPYARYLVPVLGISARGNVLRMRYAGETLRSANVPHAYRDYPHAYRDYKRQSLKGALNKLRDSGIIRRSLTGDLHYGNISMDGRLLDYA